MSDFEEGMNARSLLNFFGNEMNGVGVWVKLDANVGGWFGGGEDGARCVGLAFVA